MEEIWKPIPGSAWHEASSLGRIRSIDIDYGRDKRGRKRSRKGKLLSFWQINTGYYTVVTTSFLKGSITPKADLKVREKLRKRD